MRENVKDMSRRQLEETVGGAAAKELSRFVNGSSWQTDEFVVYFLSEHRTLQQAFTKLCLLWMYELAKDEFGHDLRNEASVNAAKKVVAALGEYGWSLPCI